MDSEELWLLKEKYEGRESDAFRADLERLRAGEPLAYLIGHVPFLNCEIYLDSKPLIPRVETEYWVEKAITAIRSGNKDVRVLDLCAGSGCVGVAVAKAVPHARVTFAEIDPLHLPTIEKNLSRNLPHYSRESKQYSVIQSDLFEKVEGQFDFILTNPPYIDPVLDRTEASVKNHEPHLALYGGHNGLEIILTIINDSKKFLAPGGQLWIEHEPEQVEAIRESAEAEGFCTSPYNDQYGVNRFSIFKYK